MNRYFEAVHFEAVHDDATLSSFGRGALTFVESNFCRRREPGVSAVCTLRWPETHGSPVCPKCGCLEFYDLKARRRFKCAACHHQFSATSGMIFASHKLSFVELLDVICLLVNVSKGLSAVQLSRDPDVQYKTTFVLMHKLREAMARETTEARLADEVEIDGAYFGGHVRPMNARKNRVDRRLLQHHSGDRAWLLPCVSVAAKR